MNNLNDCVVFIRDILIPIVQGVVTILALLIGSFVGVVGLNTWKKELSAKNNFELYRHIMIAVYKVREAIQEAHMGDYWGEFVNIGIELEQEDKELRQLAKRVASAQGEVNNLNIELLEVEAVWGKDVKDKINNITEYLNKIMNAESELKCFHKHIQNEDRDDVIISEQQEMGDCRSILYRSRSSKFSEKLNNEVVEIEDMLRKKFKI